MNEVSQLNVNIEKLEQYGRQTSLRFHNVPMAQGDLQKNRPNNCGYCQHKTENHTTTLC